MELVIISYGFDFENSSNANAHCLNEILSYLSEKRRIIIFTTTNKQESYFSIKYNICIHYFSIDQYKNIKKAYIPWFKTIQNYLMKNDIKKYNLLTVSFPIHTHLIGYKLKAANKEIHWLVYELDPYAYNEVLRLPNLLFPYRFIIQKKIYKKADIILLTQESYNQYKNEAIMQFSHQKWVNCGIPILNFNEDFNYIANDDLNHFIYVGTFYKKIREPFHMLDTMLLLVNQLENFRLDIYGEEFKPEYRRYVEESEGRIVFHGRIPKEKVREVIAKSNYLVNIGNNVSNQLPSKVLEYIGYQKPILNFVSIENDPCIPYLTKYSNALIIGPKSNEHKRDSDKIIEFIRGQKQYINKTKLFEEFERYTVESISKHINSLMK